MFQVTEITKISIRKSLMDSKEIELMYGKEIALLVTQPHFRFLGWVFVDSSVKIEIANEDVTQNFVDYFTNVKVNLTKLTYKEN